MCNELYSRIFADVRQKKPLVHHITNYVTVNDCANITLSLGAAPVMAHAPEEVADMVTFAGALVLNIGTLDNNQVASMILAGKAAGKQGIPIILDPVGAGATSFRTRIACQLIDELDISIIKGNAGEIGTLAGRDARVRGVDSGGVTGNPTDICREYAEESGVIVAMSGPVDLVSDGKEVLEVRNGHSMMGRISGTGCMASSVTGGCAAVTSDLLSSTVTALALFGLAGEMAAKKAAGPGSFRIALHDCLAVLEPADLAAGCRIIPV